MGKRIADIEGISEETANELISIFKESINTKSCFISNVKIFINTKLTAKQIELQLKLMKLMIYDNKATFLTKWYYKKKIQKTEYQIKSIEKAYSLINDKSNE